MEQRDIDTFEEKVDAKLLEMGWRRGPNTCLWKCGPDGTLLSMHSGDHDRWFIQDYNEAKAAVRKDEQDALNYATAGTAPGGADIMRSSQVANHDAILGTAPYETD